MSDTPTSLTQTSRDALVEIHCGCGAYSIRVSDTAPIYTFGALCPKCGNHFGWSSDPETDEDPAHPTSGTETETETETEMEDIERLEVEEEEQRDDPSPRRCAYCHGEILADDGRTTEEGPCCGKCWPRVRPGGDR